MQISTKFLQILKVKLFFNASQYPANENLMVKIIKNFMFEFVSPLNKAL